MDLFTVQQVSELTGISVETLNQWRSQEKGPPYLKIEGRLVRYRKADLVEYFAACRVSASDRKDLLVPVPNRRKKDQGICKNNQ